MSKPRQFIAVYDTQEKSHVEIPELFANQLLAEKYEKPFRVIEKSAYDELEYRRDTIVALADERIRVLEAKLRVAVEAFDRIISVSGTSCEHYHIAKEAAKKINSLTNQVSSTEEKP